jgi:acetoin utilization deacetylase AcuC-like enzyme
VLYCSIHADPDQEYPYFWGSADENGAGPGTGYNLNYPLPLGTGDAAYLDTLDRCLAQVKAFQPESLVVSTGFDIVTGDPAGGFNLSKDCLEEIARRIARLTHAGLPTILILEGGYLLDSLGVNAVSFLSQFQA